MIGHTDVCLVQSVPQSLTDHVVNPPDGVLCCAMRVHGASAAVLHRAKVMYELPPQPPQPIAPIALYGPTADGGMYRFDLLAELYERGATRAGTTKMVQVRMRLATTEEDPTALKEALGFAQDTAVPVPVAKPPKRRRE